MPRFSIIVPCYNADASLLQTIASVQAQTFRDWELLCMDDGSTDQTPRLISAASSSDSRIRAFRQANAGPAAARNRAIELATGEIIAFLDADDLWVPQKLAALDRRFRQLDAPDAVFSRVGFFKSDPYRPGTVSTVPNKPLKLLDLVGENPVCTMSNIALTTAAWRRSGGIDPDIVHAEDLEWLIRLVASGARVIGMQDVLTLYRANENGLSANLSAMHRGWARAVRTATAIDPAIGRKEVAAGEAVHLRYLARRALRTGQPPMTAISFALRGVKSSPRGFFSPPRRGLAVLGAALLAPILPAPVRRFGFQE